MVGVSNIDTNHHGSVLVCKKMRGGWIWAIYCVWMVWDMKKGVCVKIHAFCE